MSAFFFSKQPSEEFSIAVDFATLRLESGESVVTDTVTAILCSDDTDATADVIASSGEAAGVVTIAVKNGVDGERYKITAVVTTDAGSIYEQDVLMKVKNR